jgi:hypothetical protein
VGKAPPSSKRIRSRRQTPRPPGSFQRPYPTDTPPLPQLRARMNKPACTWIKSVNAEHPINEVKSDKCRKCRLPLFFLFRRRELLFCTPSLVCLRWTPLAAAEKIRWPPNSVFVLSLSRLIYMMPAKTPAGPKEVVCTLRRGFWHPRGYKIRPVNIKAKNPYSPKNNKIR